MGKGKEVPTPFHVRSIYRGDGRGRTFSVNLDTNVFHCFDAKCGAKGDVIDLWGGVAALDLRAAAVDLVHPFHLEPVPPIGTGEEARLRTVSFEAKKT